MSKVIELNKINSLSDHSGVGMLQSDGQNNTTLGNSDHSDDSSLYDENEPEDKNTIGKKTLKTPKSPGFMHNTTGNSL